MLSRRGWKGAQAVIIKMWRDMTEIEGALEEHVGTIITNSGSN